MRSAIWPSLLVVACHQGTAATHDASRDAFVVIPDAPPDASVVDAAMFCPFDGFGSEWNPTGARGGEAVIAGGVATLAFGSDAVPSGTIQLAAANSERITSIQTAMAFAPTDDSQAGVVVTGAASEIELVQQGTNSVVFLEQGGSLQEVARSNVAPTYLQLIVGADVDGFSGLSVVPSISTDGQTFTELGSGAFQLEVADGPLNVAVKLVDGVDGGAGSGAQFRDFVATCVP